MVGFGLLADRRELLHQLVVDVESPGRVEDDDVTAVRLRPLQALPHRGDGVLRLLPVDGNLDLATQLLELVDGCRSLEVGRDERRLLALLAQEQGELRSRRRLARSLEAGEEDDRWPLRGECELGAAGAHERGELLVDDLHDLLSRREALEDILPQRALANVGDEVLDDLEVDVCLEQREPISRMAREIASSSRRPFLRRSPRASCSLSDRLSNTTA